MSTQQAKKRIALFPLEKKNATTPDYNGNIEWDNTTDADKRIGDVLVYKNVRHGRRILTGVIIYAEAVAKVIEREKQKFIIDIIIQQDEDEKKPTVKGLMLMEGETEAIHIALWKYTNDKVKEGYYFSGVIGNDDVLTEDSLI
jgi:hypothetical protein